MDNTVVLVRFASTFARNVYLCQLMFVLYLLMFSSVLNTADLFCIPTLRK